MSSSTSFNSLIFSQLIVFYKGSYFCCKFLILMFSVSGCVFVILLWIFFLLRMVFLKRDHEFKKKKKNKAVSKQLQLEKVMYKKARTL